jgi:hypothetical protein
VTTIQITLPDDLAESARDAGLLDPEAIQGMLRLHLRHQALEDLQRLWKKMPPAALTPEVEADVVAAVRECRATLQGRQGA